MFYDDEMENVSTDESTQESESTDQYTPAPAPEPEPDLTPDIQERMEEPSYKPREEPQYEPWREPVYREPEDHAGAYTPGIHGAQRRTPAAELQSKPERKKKNHGFLKAVCLVLVCALAASAASYAVIDYKLKDYSAPAPEKTVTINRAAVPDNKADAEASPAPLVSTGSEMTAAEIYEMGCQQVVGLKTSVTTTNIFGQTSSGAVSGSGFIISDDGYIVTNYHVIEYSVLYGYELSVMLYDGSTYPADIIGYEEENDLAVVKIEATGLNAVTLGSSSKMIVGQQVYAIGNPLGELEYTMTGGIVSALDRVITTADQTTGTTTSISMFQIDAAVNSGNSGGPVYNSKGEVIGIVSAKYSSSGVEGLGFAIPMDDAFTIVSDLIENGYVTGKAYFGITVRTLTTSYAQYYGLVEGAYVETVTPGSCAETAGLEAGDIITKLGDYEVTTRDDLLNAKKNYKAGDTVSVTAFRGGEYLEFILTFDEEPPASAATEPQEQQQQQQQGGQYFFSNPFGNFGGFGGFGN